MTKKKKKRQREKILRCLKVVPYVVFFVFCSLSGASGLEYCGTQEMCLPAIQMRVQSGLIISSVQYNSCSFIHHVCPRWSWKIPRARSLLNQANRFIQKVKKMPCKIPLGQQRLQGIVLQDDFSEPRWDASLLSLSLRSAVFFFFETEIKSGPSKRAHVYWLIKCRVVWPWTKDRCLKSRLSFQCPWRAPQ